jgi:hypothetical protein
MLERLPLLYREGELARDVLASPAMQLEIMQEDTLEVQRAHWFDAALELAEAADLAAVLDIAPEPWQRLGEFRAWVHAIRDAMRFKGAVTKQALQDFIADYARRYQSAVGVIVTPPITVWTDDPTTGEPAFVENPPLRRYERAGSAKGIEPLHRFKLTQRGLDETYAGFMLIGLPSSPVPESVPVIANLTTGQALIYMGTVPPGARLWIRPTPANEVEAILEGEDVTERMYSVSDMQPGVAWSKAQMVQPAQAIKLQRGENELWFLPVAHFDAPGLDRFLLALADLTMQQGRYDKTDFNQALFYQEPAVKLYTTWQETQPASFEVHLPAGTMMNAPGEMAEGLETRDRLEFSLNQAVNKLKAAGVQGSVTMRPFCEVQGQLDCISTAVLPMFHREVGPTGADTLTHKGAAFEITDFDKSTFR